MGLEHENLDAISQASYAGQSESEGLVITSEEIDEGTVYRIQADLPGIQTVDVGIKGNVVRYIGTTREVSPQISVRRKFIFHPEDGTPGRYIDDEKVSDNWDVAQLPLSEEVVRLVEAFGHQNPEYNDPLKERLTYLRQVPRVTES